MRHVVNQFRERSLIPASASDRFEGAIAAAFRLRNSVLAEMLLIAFVYVVGIDRLAALLRAHCGDLVRRRPPGDEVVSHRILVCLREPAVLPVPAAALVFPMLIWGRFLWHVSRTS
jgi:hypothetical protein